jgi:hypothetical protein
VGPSTSGTGTQFNATVNATTGKVLYDQTVMDVSCSSSGSTLVEPGAGPSPAAQRDLSVRPRTA